MCRHRIVKGAAYQRLLFLWFSLVLITLCVGYFDSFEGKSNLVVALPRIPLLSAMIDKNSRKRLTLPRSKSYFHNRSKRQSHCIFSKPYASGRQKYPFSSNQMIAHERQVDAEAAFLFDVAPLRCAFAGDKRIFYLSPRYFPNFTCSSNAVYSRRKKTPKKCQQRGEACLFAAHNGYPADNRSSVEILPFSIPYAKSIITGAPSLAARDTCKNVTDCKLEQTHCSTLHRPFSLVNQTFTRRNARDWSFFDVMKIHVKAGNGGNGCLSFNREKFVPLGGPDGGNGGNGGSVFVQCSPNINSLYTLRRKRHYLAEKGGDGSGNCKKGRKGKDVFVLVPVGSILRNESGDVIVEIMDENKIVKIANGGRGGRGNRAFKTNKNVAPRISEPGEVTEESLVEVELKVVADIGLIGKPNAGKSSLLSAVSNAHPKIANYPFTTVSTHLGVCDFPEVLHHGNGKSLVIADIPGLLSGAHNGVGMGISFLRHIERCRILLHIVDGISEHPLEDYNAIINELKLYNSSLLQKPQVIAINKSDISDVLMKFDALKQLLHEKVKHSRIVCISALKGYGVKDLMVRLRKLLNSIEYDEEQKKITI